MEQTIADIRNETYKETVALIWDLHANRTAETMDDIFENLPDDYYEGIAYLNNHLNDEDEDEEE